MAIGGAVFTPIDLDLTIYVSARSRLIIHAEVVLLPFALVDISVVQQGG